MTLLLDVQFAALAAGSACAAASILTGSRPADAHMHAYMTLSLGATLVLWLVGAPC